MKHRANREMKKSGDVGVVNGILKDDTNEGKLLQLSLENSRVQKGSHHWIHRTRRTTSSVSSFLYHSFASSAIASSQRSRATPEFCNSCVCTGCNQFHSSHNTPPTRTLHHSRHWRAQLDFHCKTFTIAWSLVDQSTSFLPLHCHITWLRSPDSC